jgi:hypothetical protein
MTYGVGSAVICLKTLDLREGLFPLAMPDTENALVADF